MWLSWCLQVGNCVAKRNYRYFYLFLNTVLVMAVYVMGCNIAVIVLGKPIYKSAVCLYKFSTFHLLQLLSRWVLATLSRITLQDILSVLLCLSSVVGIWELKERMSACRVLMCNFSLTDEFSLSLSLVSVALEQSLSLDWPVCTRGWLLPCKRPMRTWVTCHMT